jgi:hypothetical protein
MSSTVFGSLYKLYSSLFHLGCQHPPSCVGLYILRNIFLSNGFSICSDVCVKVMHGPMNVKYCGALTKICYDYFVSWCYHGYLVYQSYKCPLVMNDNWLLVLCELTRCVLLCAHSLSGSHVLTRTISKRNVIKLTFWGKCNFVYFLSNLSKLHFRVNEILFISFEIDQNYILGYM